MGASWSSIAAGVAINYLFENNNFANGYREFYREYMHLHCHHTMLQELDLAASLWRSLTEEERRSYIRRHVHRQMSSARSVSSVSDTTTSFSAPHIHDSEQESEYQSALTPHLLSASQR
ncbi:hypothetical protein CBL_12339 [Carabus blaptoides fortunei]